LVAAPGVVFPVSLPSRKDQTMPAHVYREVRHTVNGPPLPKPQPTISAQSSLRRVSVALRCEESDHYARVIALLNPQWRVIACADGIQWILQIRRGQGWRNRYFFRSRVGLISGCREYAGDIGGDALVILLQLPRFFPEAAP
jgi:hypothetical protein